MARPASPTEHGSARRRFRHAEECLRRRRETGSVPWEAVRSCPAAAEPPSQVVAEWSCPAAAAAEPSRGETGSSRPRSDFPSQARAGRRRRPGKEWSEASPMTLQARLPYRRPGSASISPAFRGSGAGRQRLLQFLAPRRANVKVSVGGAEEEPPRGRPGIAAVGRTRCPGESRSPRRGRPSLRRPRCRTCSRGPRTRQRRRPPDVQDGGPG